MYFSYLQVNILVQVIKIRNLHVLSTCSFPHSSNNNRTRILIHIIVGLY